MAPGGMNQPNMNQQFHSHQPMNGYNSNVPFNGMGMAQSMTNMSQQQPGPNISPQTIPNDNNHHHNQTGSNYDELPLEFIHNMGQSSTNTNNQIGLGPSPNSGYPPKQSPQPGPYEEIIFDQDNLSSAPSNPDSYAVCIAYYYPCTQCNDIITSDLLYQHTETSKSKCHQRTMCSSI